MIDAEIITAPTVERFKADRWATNLGVYAEVAPDRNVLAKFFTHAKFEPVYGCYLSAYVQADQLLPHDEQRISEEVLGHVLHKKLAVAWDYSEYGHDFPANWARTLLHRGIVPEIALEPNRGLNSVRNDDTLQQFARDAAGCNGPVFLRFAGEMNGDWTAYHGDPALYRAKFRLVHDVMAKLAPNVAMIWCVNHIPHENIDQYYPGDDYVDWVGVNFYSVLHHDNDPRRSAISEHPASLLRYVYDKYASRKPIAICEYGASHREQLAQSQDRADVAAVKYAELMSALPRQFPRVKMVGLYDSDNLTARFVRADRRLNDYSVTDNMTLTRAVTEAVSPDYFLSEVVTDEQKDLPNAITRLVPGTVLSSPAKISVWVNTYDLEPTVITIVDGKVVSREHTPGTYVTFLNYPTLGPGVHRLHIDILDMHGHHAGASDTSFILKPS